MVLILFGNSNISKILDYTWRKSLPTTIRIGQAVDVIGRAGQKHSGCTEIDYRRIYPFFDFIIEFIHFLVIVNSIIY